MNKIVKIHTTDWLTNDHIIYEHNWFTNDCENFTNSDNQETTDDEKKNIWYIIDQKCYINW